MKAGHPTEVASFFILKEDTWDRNGLRGGREGPGTFPKPEFPLEPPRSLGRRVWGSWRSSGRLSSALQGCAHTHTHNK